MGNPPRKLFSISVVGLSQLDGDACMTNAEMTKRACRIMYIVDRNCFHDLFWKKILKTVYRFSKKFLRVFFFLVFFCKNFFFLQMYSLHRLNRTAPWTSRFCLSVVDSFALKLVLLWGIYTEKNNSITEFVFNHHYIHHISNNFPNVKFMIRFFRVSCNFSIEI